MNRIPTEDKARKRLKLWTYLTKYFPDAFIAEAEVAIIGNEQHNPGEPLHWAREKSTDQMNTAFRHQLDYAAGVRRDTDGQHHLAKAVWRLKAELQLDLERERDENDARRKSEAGSESLTEEARGVLPHAGAERDGVSGLGLSRLRTGDDHGSYGRPDRGAVRGSGDKSPGR